MTLHLVKLCVGAPTIEDLGDWQKGRLAELKKARRPQKLFHATFQAPKRQVELLDGGSLYWVIKGFIQVRQRLVGFEDGQKNDGSPCCHLMLDPELIAVVPTPRRAFQGWRYLDGEDAPADLSGGRDGLASMPAKMRKELADLGLL